MTRGFLIAALLALSCVPFSSAQTSSDLDRALSSMDKAAASFHTTEANFVWDQYSKVVDETDNQKGKVYYRRNSDEVQMAAEITAP